MSSTGVRLRLLAVLAALAAPACSAGSSTDAPAATAKKRGGGKPAVLGTAQRFTQIGTREPSGVVYDAKLGHLFVVGDEGVLVELDKTPAVVRVLKVKGNLEDLAVHTPTGKLVLLSEQKSELIYYDPVAAARKARWQLDTAALLGPEGAGVDLDSRNGFEGLGFKEDAGRPGGGVFYLARQKSPHLVIGIAFDPEKSPSGPLAPQVVSRWDIGRAELRSATYAPELQRLLVLSRKGLTLVTLDGAAQKAIDVPGEQPEGVCLDDDGTMWIADDPGHALFKIPRALEALRSASTP
jgi:uncharacterized protein YjiK